LTARVWAEVEKPKALKSVAQRFSGVLVRAILDDATIIGDMESIFSEEGARQQLATDLANIGSNFTFFF
jgi:hypothetical protein